MIDQSPHLPSKKERTNSTMKTIRIVWLAVEMALRTAGSIGVWVVAVTPGSVTEKVYAGYNFPSEIKKRIDILPREIEHAQYLIRLTDEIEKLQASDANWIKHGYEILAFAKDHFWDITQKLPEIARAQIEKSRDLMVIKNNIEHMPRETLESMILVLMSYLLLAHLVRFFRIWDRDTFTDAIRKKVYRKTLWLSDPEVFTQEVSMHFQEHFWKIPTEKEIITLLDEAMRARKWKSWE